MAIKERKQITGTTAQIDVYAGHEGQIVWDKEKKTLVGMSGTAGNNYPLASKEYVDNEVAKCLPLTGGNMLNTIGFQGKAHLGYNFSNPEIEECALSFFDSQGKNLGGFITLRGPNGSKEDEKGSFMLAARSGDGSITNVFFGDVAGNLMWLGNPISRTTGMGSGWVRYSNGLQFCWGGIITPKDTFNTAVNLPVPYANTGYVITAMYTDANAVPSVDVAVGNKNPNAFTIAAASPAYNWHRYCEWFTIGNWK